MDWSGSRVTCVRTSSDFSSYLDVDGVDVREHRKHPRRIISCPGEHAYMIGVKVKSNLLAQQSVSKVDHSYSSVRTVPIYPCIRLIDEVLALEERTQMQ
jgi:hypothetical protein